MEEEAIAPPIRTINMKNHKRVPHCFINHKSLFRKDFSKAFECYEKAMKLTRKPSEMLLLMAEYLMAEARVDAINYLEQHPA